MASLELKRSVRVTLTRIADVSHRISSRQLSGGLLGRRSEGRLQSIMHDAVASTSHYEDYQEAVVNWSGMMYHCDNVKLSLRAGQARHGDALRYACAGCSDRRQRALECAMDELSYEVGIDPLEFRRINFASKDENTDKQLTSKALRPATEKAPRLSAGKSASPAPRSTPRGARTGRMGHLDRHVGCIPA